jgi:phosphate/sulfate permease
MNIRAQAVGMCSQTQNVVNSIVQQFFPLFLKNEGFYAFYMFAAINILLAAFVWFFVPETKKVSLEEMDAIFGGQNHVVEGAAIEEKDPARHHSIVEAKSGAVERVERA